MRPSREEMASHAYFRFFAQPHFPRTMPEALFERGIFSDVEWSREVLRPLDDISLMIFPPARYISSLMFIPLGLILCVFTKMLPEIGLLIFACIGLLGLINGYLSTRIVADIYFGRLMTLLNHHHAEKNVSFRYTSIRESSSYTLRYVTISYKQQAFDPVVDEEYAVGVIACGNTPFVAIPIDDDRDIEAQS